MTNMTDMQLELFYKNTLKLSEAIQTVGGRPFSVLCKHQEFIELISRNGIEINAIIYEGIANG
jgi:hypothetical protein